MLNIKKKKESRAVLLFHTQLSLYKKSNPPGGYAFILSSSQGVEQPVLQLLSPGSSPQPDIPTFPIPELIPAGAEAARLS